MQQNQDGTYDPNGHVFVHRKTTTGLDFFTGKPLKKEGIWRTWDWLRTHVPDIIERRAMPHGVRTTFETWIAENEYARDIARMALGHTIHSNKTDEAYGHQIKMRHPRRKGMEAWEKYCFSFALPPGTVIPFRSQPSMRGRAKHA